MTGNTATEVRSNLYRLIDETAESHLLSVPSIREPNREGMETPVDEGDDQVKVLRLWSHYE